MRITEWMDDLKVDEEIIEKIGFQDNCNLSKKKIQKSVLKKIGKDNVNPFYLYGRRVIIATAVCAVIVGALFGWNVIGHNLKQMETADTSANTFVLYAKAAELKSEVPVLLNDSGFEGSMGSGEDGNVGYNIVLPFYCKGDNIKSITYKISGAVFGLADCPSAKSLISKKEVPSDSKYWDVSFAHDVENIYTEFTIAYKSQVKPGGVTRFIHMIGEKNVANADAVGGTDIKKEKLMFDEVFKDVVIECVVNFNDGSKQGRKIHIENKIMTMQEACPGRKVAFPNRKGAFITLVCE